MPRQKAVTTKKNRPKVAKRVTKKTVKKIAPLSAFKIQVPQTSSIHGHAIYDHTKNLGPEKKIDEKSQKLIMWLGVSVVMSVIIIVWALNLNRIIGAHADVTTSPTSQQMDFEKLKTDLTQTMSQVKNGLQQLNELTPPTSTATPITDTAKPAVPNTLPN